MPEKVGPGTYFLGNYLDGLRKNKRVVLPKMRFQKIIKIEEDCEENISGPGYYLAPSDFGIYVSSKIGKSLQMNYWKKTKKGN